MGRWARGFATSRVVLICLGFLGLVAFPHRVMGRWAREDGSSHRVSREWFWILTTLFYDQGGMRLLFVLSICALLFGYGAYCSLNRQINLSIQALGCARQVKRFKETEGSYPRQLRCPSSEFGTITYKPTDTGFELRATGVLGADGAKIDQHKQLICFQPWRDIVFTEIGPKAYCLK
jgi:hypothetical protein